MTFPYGEMLAVLRRTPTRDRWGDGDEFAESHEIGPCGVEDGDSTEVGNNREAVEADFTVYAPLGSDVQATDRVECRGLTCRVIGRPRVYGRHPMTGSMETSGVIVRLAHSQG